MMLKRQRSTPSFTPDVYATPEPAIDMADRAFKRRRQFPPPHASSEKGKEPWRPDSDGEEDIDTEEHFAGCFAPSAQSRCLEQAGEYKHVNSLLHDLHAEQRHRMLFSSSTLPAHLSRTHLDPHSCTTKSTPPTHGPLSVMPLEHRHASFTIAISSKDASVVDPVEVQRVTERYEDTNRYLGALFLRRRRQYDNQENDNQAS